MDDFPDFMKNPANRIATTDQAKPKLLFVGRSKY